MKYLLAIATLALTGCETLPIRGKICYATSAGEVCAESDGKSVVLSGNLK